MDILPQNTILDSALRYAELGLSVIPVGRDKKPLIAWQRYQEERATKEQILSWWKKFPNANVAIVTGKISGIVVIDVEAGGSIDDLPFTAQCRTGGGGWHFYFAHPGTPIKNGVRVKELTDVRADGGFVVAPPSLHASGQRYEWDAMFSLITGENIKNLASIPEWVSRSGSMPKPVLGNFLAPASVTQPVLEGSRNDAAIRFAGKILHYNPPEIWEMLYPAMQAWNASVVKPPLSEFELRRTWESGMRMEQGKQSRESEVIQLKPSVSFKELCETEFPEVKWAIESLFESATINMLSAAPNQYKSWVVHHMAICLARGENVFGRFVTQQQPVLVVNEEDSMRLIKERSLMLTAISDDIPVYLYAEQGFKLTDKVVDGLLAEMKSKGVRFLILDSLRSIHSADENSSTEMQKIMDQLKRITREGVTVLVTHHNRKRSRQPGTGKDDLGEETRGSSAINGALHGHLSCEPLDKDGCRYLVIGQKKLKGAKKLLPFTVCIDEGNGQFGFTYQGEFKPVDDALEQAKQAIVSLLAKSDRWLAVKDFIAADVGAERAVRDALRDLAEAEAIQAKTRQDLERIGASMATQGGKHNEKLYYRRVVIDEDDES
jgi:hypothetical protein